MCETQTGTIRFVVSNIRHASDEVGMNARLS